MIKPSQIAQSSLIYEKGKSLIYCDAFANMKAELMANQLTRDLTNPLPKPCVIGPNWIKFAKPSKKALFNAGDHDFSNLLTAHGNHIFKDAKEMLLEQIEALKT